MGTTTPSWFSAKSYYIYSIYTAFVYAYMCVGGRASLVNTPMYFFSSSTTLQTYVYTLSSMKDKFR